ncbi:hypothetical protein D7319_13270 [Streptomyces radicis]|uniref:WXG100 family type VII secretion target n=1 Tax=Streptomyces radicis TaxID=1750517 RepID=A0A3A9W8J3_9ACTN|nr:hypothetical protein D7319_13270 [Streptomyces radicis]RKN22985.1 hypothetical protein D7318_13255 [Streptomyces radicis]
MDAAGKLSTTCNIIVPEIYSLMGTVGTLLDEGLYLEQASPALKTAYEEFSKSMQAAAAGLQNWANLLTAIKDAFENNDAELFAITLSAIDGEGGFEVTANEVTTTPGEVPKWDSQHELNGTPVDWNEDRTRLEP